MNHVVQSQEPVYSAYRHDPELSDLVAIFAEDLPGRVANLRSYLDCDDFANLARAVQQLRLSTARYGFDQVAPCMQQFESLVQQFASREELELAFQDVVDMCDRVRAGGPE